MIKKLARMSLNQLKVIQIFLDCYGDVLTLSELEKKTGLRGKSLGGVLSSLSRTQFRGTNLISPLGRSLDGIGLRWKLTDNVMDEEMAASEVNRLLSSF